MLTDANKKDKKKIKKEQNYKINKIITSFRLIFNIFNIFFTLLLVMLTDANKKDKKEQKYSFFKKCPADAIVKKRLPYHYIQKLYHL